ncbi:MAG: hypothetical protein DRP78_00020 [Candidatus Omnitrophota bacterium]|nr:MAG: hypothetical protein DRP78_00020 [Candidatus Omnitrophota bacterium]
MRLSILKHIGYSDASAFTPSSYLSKNPLTFKFRYHLYYSISLIKFGKIIKIFGSFTESVGKNTKK